MTRIIKPVLFALLSPLLGETMHAATYTAASCAESDVSAAIASASSSGGDTVVIPTCTSTTPGGSNTWTSTLTITKPITFQGQDSPGGTGGGTGQTVLIDNVTKTPCTDAPLIHMASSATTGWRITGITIQGDAPDTGVCSEHLSVGTGSHAFRIDHVAFTNQTATAIITDGDEWGVIDHCTFAGVFKRGVIVHHTTWQNVGVSGDNSWAQPDTMGTQEAVYVEANAFSGLTDSSSASNMGAEYGARAVFRFNTGVEYSGSHGTDSSGRSRGVRHVEVYNNSYNSQGDSTINTGFLLRSGTAMIFNNTLTDSSGYAYTTASLLANYREFDSFLPWCAAEGTNKIVNTGSYSTTCMQGASSWDVTDGVIYASGTAKSGSTANGSGPQTLVDTSASFSSIGSAFPTHFSVINVTQQWSDTITSYTSTSVSGPASSAGGLHNWTVGDTYNVRLSYPILDGIGRGQGKLMSGSPPSPVASQNQALDPVYVWGNRTNGSSSTTQVGAQYNRITANQDYYLETPSFTGTTGVGIGTLANRPSTCTPRVGYWATDQGNWNQSGSGSQGELFVCTATNTWTLYYTPYTYPHPLTQGGGTGTGATAPPTNFVATPH